METESENRPLETGVSLRWSKEEPTAEGFYWNDDGGGRANSVEIYQVIKAACGFVGCRPLTGYRERVNKIGGKWYGPLEVPQAN